MSRLLLWGAALFVMPRGGCSMITVNSPTGSNVTTPSQLQVTTSGTPDNFGVLTVNLDGNDLTHYNGGNYQYTPTATMFALNPGGHNLTVSGTDSWGVNTSGSSAFTVTSSPLAYSCPTGYVHAFTVQCCDGNQCDVPSFTNFGISFLNNPSCNQLQSMDCINQNGVAVCGASAPYCGISGGSQTDAVSFVPTTTGKLSHIQIPVKGAVTGGTAFQLWITTDNMGQPGGIVEGPLGLNNIPNFTINYVVAPMHVFSLAKPTLTAGQTYWLVVAPATNTTTGSWLISSGDTPSGTNFLTNTTAGASGIPGLNGPWDKVTANDFPLRPAFEIDLR